jgi:hypothetical protein
MRDLLYRGRGGNCWAYDRKHEPCNTNYAPPKRRDLISFFSPLVGKSLSPLQCGAIRGLRRRNYVEVISRAISMRVQH